MALPVSGRSRALLGFAAVAAAVGLGMLVTLHLSGIQGYLATLLAPQVAGDTAQTLRSALAVSPAVIAIQAAAVIAVAAVASHGRRTRTAWPVVVAALLGSFLLATYWHPQDYLVLDAAAAIMLAARPMEADILMAAAVAVASTPVSPFSSRQMTVAWLLLAIVGLAFLAVRTLARPRSVSVVAVGPEPGSN